MDFIQSSNKAVDLFGAGKHGFGAGNPTTGVLATFFSADWSNNVQQELVNAIEGAGIVIAPDNRSQLLAAIQALITGRFTGGNQSFGSNGFQKLPGGLILQWGSGSQLQQTTGFWSFPIAFNTPLNMVISKGSSIDTQHESAIGANIYSASQFTVTVSNETSGSLQGFLWFAVGF